MLVPIKWLNEYVDINDIEIKEIEEAMILTGSNIETTKEVAEGVLKVVVGRIEKIRKHPNADKLIVMDVSVKDEKIQIVTGATNCQEGKYVPVALNGSWIANGVKIKKGKLRGVESNGMLCSLDELGFSSKVIPKYFDDGILILDKEYELGQSIKEAIEMDDSVIEFEITPNRPDCLSMIGMAREFAATFNKELKFPEIKIKEEVEDIKDYCSIEIKDKDLCPRYAARVVKDVKIGDSPLWMQLRLMKAGMRPISNIVDIANYVMLEFGHPIHTFDLDAIEDRKIIVRRAKEDEIIKTLDGQDRKLSPDMLVIADKNKSVAIAGVMGGENSEISSLTKNILVEVANFNKSSVRKTSKDMGLRSEASSRFEKGVSTYGTEKVLNRVCQLIEEICDGTVIKGILDEYPVKYEKISIDLRVERVNKFIGINITKEEIAKFLNNIEIETEIKDDIILCHIPECRMDLEKEIDLIEEVARFYGYDKIPTTVPKGMNWGAKTNGQTIEDFSRDVLLSCGINETTTYSFVSPSSVDSIKLPEDSILRNQVILLNPLGEEYSAMRTTLVSNALEVIARNINRNVENVKIFEIGNIFLPKSVPVKELPVETKRLSIGICNKKDDFFTLKGVVETLFNRLGIDNFYFEAESNHKTFHPGRCGNIIKDNHILGVIGEVHPKVLENYGLKEKTYIADIDFNAIMQLTRLDGLFTPIPKYPAVTRDIALIVKENVTARDIETIIKKNGGNILESVKLFDIYRGKQIDDGHKSLAYALVFRHAEKTLTDEEITKIYNKILKELEKELEAKLR